MEEEFVNKYQVHSCPGHCTLKRRVRAAFCFEPRSELQGRAVLSSAATTCRSWKEAAGLELLQRHGAGVSPEEEDKGHQCDVRHVAARLANQLASVLQALVLA